MSAAHAAGRHSMFSVFRNRDFTLLWSAQTISEFGTGITSIAASILVFRATGSAMSVGLMLMATALPGLLFGLIAGVFVDRYDRKRIMVACEVIRCLLVLCIPFMIQFGMVWLYLLVMASSTVAQFFNPAHASVLPEIATDEDLGAANSFLSASQMGALGLGFAVAGLISARFSIAWAFYLDAFTFLLSGIAILFVAIPQVRAEGSASVGLVVRNLRDGARFLFDSPVLRSLLFISAPMAVLFGFHNSLLLPFADRALGATEFEYGLIEGLSMVGFFVGGLWMAKVADRLREGQWIAVSFIGMGVVTAIYAGISTVPVAILLGVLSAFLNVPSYIGRVLLIQRNTTSEVRGRVTSTFFVTRDFLFMIGMGAAGLADIFDIRALVLAEGLLLLLMGGLVLILPGLGQPAAEWRRSISMLRGIGEAPGLGVGRSATLADLDLFASRLPAMACLTIQERQRMVPTMRYMEAEPGTAVVRQEEKSDAAYFILEGRAVAGTGDHVFEVMNAGDFFGEIAALNGVPRTADVIVDQITVLLKVPAATLREMVEKPEISQIFSAKLNERMMRTNMLDIPRLAEPDQELMRQLRTESPEPAV